MQHIAKISSKGQVTIPAAIREALGAGPGDRLIWDLSADGTVLVRRVREIDVEYLSALTGTLSEWDSAEDDEAFREL
ncbi:MAG: AbrB/MazE/SpoVT family DNA-binding domain-containing protein [Wenzhouxiangella sp.]